MKKKRRNPTPKKGRYYPGDEVIAVRDFGVQTGKRKPAAIYKGDVLRVISFGPEGVIFVTPRRTAVGLTPDRFFELTESLEDIS